MCLLSTASVLTWVAVQTKALLLAVVCAALTGCAHYDVSFNRHLYDAQYYLDNYRHVQGRLEQGQLP
jgi:hypothetical protein